MGYDNDIYVISGGGGATPTGTGDFLVRTIDYDGTLLKQEYVNYGENATPLTHPSHDLLTADGYNNSYDNITRDTDVGLMYKTTDGKTYFFIRLTNLTGMQPTIYLTKADTSLMTVTWGDSTSQTTSASGNVAITKTNPYTLIGDFTGTIETEGAWNISNTYLFNNVAGYNSCLLKLYLNGCTGFGSYAFNFLSNLTELILPSGVIGNLPISGCRKLKGVVAPSGITSFNGRSSTSLQTIVTANDNLTLGTQALYDASAYNYLLIPQNATTIGNSMSVRNYAIQSNIVIPFGVVTVNEYAFCLCYGITQYEILATTPPTLAGTTAFAGINLACKIYVPDASVLAYQDATNWNTIPNYFYPISDLGTKYANTIFFQCNGGVAVKQIRGTFGAVATEPTAPTKAGFTFDGWYKDAGLTTAWNWATDVYPATNITLYAKWI